MNSSFVGSLPCTRVLAVFPEMRTALRTYHPVPSLQMTDDNLQDAPRIKNCLKSVRTTRETQKDSMPMTPNDVWIKQVGH
jgi:Ino eighty subunit 1